MPPDEANHAAHVEAWLGAARHLPRAEIVALFERTMAGLWRRTHDTLGEITLTAIVDRVLYTASERYPLLATLKVDGTGICFDEFREQENVLHDDRLLEAIHFVLVEFLTVLGNLTADIMTPALHAQLSKSTMEEPAGPKGSQGQVGSADATRRMRRS
jgi:hypothetical protein